MKKIKLTNDFHGTEAYVIPQPITEGRFAGRGLYRVSPATAKRVWRELCGIEDCQCGDDFGARGGYLAVKNMDYEGNYIIDKLETVSAEER